MVQITLATNSERKNVLANTDKTLQQIITENGVDTTGATIMLKGNVVSAFDLDRTLSQCNVVDGESVIMNVTVKAAAALTTELDGNVFKIVTDITEETVKKGLSDLKARDDKGNEVFAVAVNNSGNASIDKFQFVGNTYIGGKLAATIVLPMADASKDSVMRKYGEALLMAKKYTEVIATEAAAKTAEIEALFN